MARIHDAVCPVYRLPAPCDAHVVAKMSSDTTHGAIIAQDPRSSAYVAVLTFDGRWIEAADCGRDLGEARERFIGYVAEAARGMEVTR